MLNTYPNTYWKSYCSYSPITNDPSFAQHSPLIFSLGSPISPAPCAHQQLDNGAGFQNRQRSTREQDQATVSPMRESPQRLAVRDALVVWAMGAVYLKSLDRP